jgi:hypothetical protein
LILAIIKDETLIERAHTVLPTSGDIRNKRAARKTSIILNNAVRRQ